MSQHYTLATYRVIPGKEQDFIHTWNDLAVTFAAQNAALWLRSSCLTTIPAAAQ